MMNNKKIIINRVVIKNSKKVVYDEIFHKGINVIRGKNSTGKSTVMELISYGLGADIKKQHWKKEALSCEKIFIDVNFNNKRFVLKRAIEDEGSKPPIFMKEGDYSSAVKETEGWSKYGYQKTENKVSFASRIFDLLGFEQHLTSDNENLTVHQIFRLLYADQDTPASNIFRWEPMNYDKESMRTAIGEFLFGFDDLTSHSLRQKIIQAENTFEKLDEELKAVYKVLGRTNIKATTSELNDELAVLHSELEEINKNIKELKRDSINAKSDELTEKAKELNAAISSISNNISSIEEQLIALVYDVEENKDFLKTLEYRKKAIQNSKATVNSLGMVSFEYCPSCLKKLSEDSSKHQCSLCKEDISEKVVNESYLQAIEQIDFQYKETSQLIGKHNEQKTLLTASLNSKLEKLKEFKSKFNEINTYSDDYELNLTKFASEKGFIESQVQAINDKLELASELDAKIQEKSDLQSLITKLKDQLTRSEFLQKSRKDSVKNAISEKVVQILSFDTGTEKSFINAKKFEFDFGQNIMLLDGRANFSASSNVLLKNSFHLAALLVACNDDKFRIPCFSMFDNIEDKGMTEDRSRNFQKIILDLCSEIETDFQIIMTTSMVDESLDNGTFGVGPFYAAGEHTLKL
ncbi:hypothetical protein ORJ04_02060 [Rheinheimera baltica]|uniref:Rad50/SbcC-type AAA domain-containing protein n=1 Tax=Rheinheimera baltica TaxID=67576 RepID=A0ABT9HUQ6_9GAMM|nr:hypothetical protein [Rheinheimera baltica]MDP5134733.1 hypothetical protein [Rheinheimera baltica]